MRFSKGKTIQKRDCTIFFFLFVLGFVIAPSSSSDKNLLTSQDSEKIPDWGNLAVLSKNRETPHCTLVPYNNLNGVIQGQPEESPFYLSLNGTWKLNWVRKPDERLREKVGLSV